MRPSLVDILESALKDQRVLGCSLSELQTKIESITQDFRRHELQPRELIGISFENGIDCIAAYFAAARYDLVVSPLPQSLPESERHLLWKRLPIRFTLSEKGLARFQEISAFSNWTKDIFWVMHSSGSTGIPKAIALTWSAVYQNAKDVQELLSLKPGETHFGSMSQCYTNGLYNSFLLPLAIQAKMVITPLASALKMKNYCDLFKQYRPEIIWTNPTVLKMMMKNLSAVDLEHSRMFVSCTAPLTHTDAVAAEKHFQKPVLQSYGLSETLIVTAERPDRDVTRDYSAGAIVGGRSAIRVQDNGLLEIQNGAVTPGYIEWKDESLKLDLPDGGETSKRFISSDLIKLNSNGDLEITGRLSNMINVDGVKVSAEQIENFLISQPGISQAAVIRLTMTNGRERPLAFIKGSQTPAKELLDLCAAELGTKARPHSVIKVDEIPVNSSGKVDRIETARRYSDLISKMADI